MECQIFNLVGNRYCSYNVKDCEITVATPMYTSLSLNIKANKHLVVNSQYPSHFYVVSFTKCALKLKRITRWGVNHKFSINVIMKQQRTLYLTALAT